MPERTPGVEIPIEAKDNGSTPHKNVAAEVRGGAQPIPGEPLKRIKLPRDIDTLMAFRLAYLRAIAAYWREESEFKTKLSKATTRALAGGKQRNQHQNVLSEYSVNYEWEWALDLTLDTESDIRFDREGNPGWSGPPNDVLIYLPFAPKDELLHVDAFAAYYSRFPTFLGARAPEPSFLRDASDDAGNDDARAGLGPLPLGMGNLQPFLEFGAVVARAIAFCWQEEFPDRTSTDVRTALLANGNAALTFYFGYRLPWNLNIRFKTIKEAVYVDGKWNDLPNNQLTLRLPRRPDIAPKLLPIALAAYNQTGEAYPFSCGC